MFNIGRYMESADVGGAKNHYTYQGCRSHISLLKEACGSLESIACRWLVSAGFPLGTILRQFGDLSKTESDLNKPMNGSCWPTSADLCDAALASATGQSETPNHVRDEGSFPPKRSPDAGDGCTADQCQPGLLLAAELGRIADAGAGDPGICNGP
jgi:hypothetical protein